MKKYSILLFLLLIIFSCSNKTKIFYEEYDELLKQNPLDKDPAIVTKRWDLKLSEKHFSKEQTIYKSAIFITFYKVIINDEIIWIPDNANFSASNKTGYADVCNYKIEIFINNKNQVCYKIKFSQLLYHDYVLEKTIDPIYNNFDDLNQSYSAVYNLIQDNKNEKTNQIIFYNEYNPFKSGDYVTFSRSYLFINTDEGLLVEAEDIKNPSPEELKKISNKEQWIINNDESMMLQNLPKGSHKKTVEPIL